MSSRVVDRPQPRWRHNGLTQRTAWSPQSHISTGVLHREVVPSHEVSRIPVMNPRIIRRVEMRSEFSEELVTLIRGEFHDLTCLLLADVEQRLTCTRMHQSDRRRVRPVTFGWMRGEIGTPLIVLTLAVHNMEIRDSLKESFWKGGPPRSVFANIVGVA